MSPVAISAAARRVIPAVVMTAVVGLLASPMAHAGDVAGATGAGPQGSVSAGPAIVRLDADVLRAEPIAEGEYLIALPAASQGQWMGERPAGRGAERPVVGKIAAKAMLAAWSKFGYRDAIGATITWSEGESVKFAHGELSTPQRKSGNAIAFRFSTVSALPLRMSDATVNLERAGSLQPRAFPVRTNVMLSRQLAMYTIVSSNSAASVQAMCNTAMVRMLNLTSSSYLMGFGDAIACDVTMAAGALTRFQIASPMQTGGVFLTATLQASGQPNMAYSSALATWTST